MLQTFTGVKSKKWTNRLTKSKRGELHITARLGQGIGNKHDTAQCTFRHIIGLSCPGLGGVAVDTDDGHEQKCSVGCNAMEFFMLTQESVLKLSYSPKHNMSFFLLRILLRTITGVIKSERFKVAYGKIQYKISSFSLWLSDDTML